MKQVYIIGENQDQCTIIYELIVTLNFGFIISGLHHILKFQFQRRKIKSPNGTWVEKDNHIRFTYYMSGNNIHSLLNRYIHPYTYRCEKFRELTFHTILSINLIYKIFPLFLSSYQIDP